MAEPDAAGHPPTNGARAPKGSQSLTLADFQREMERATEPLRAAQRAADAFTASTRAADSFMAPIRAASEAHEKMMAPIRQLERHHREIYAAIDSGIGRYLRAMVGQPATKGPPPPTPVSPADRTPPKPLPSKPTPAPPEPVGISPPALSADQILSVVKPLLDQLASELISEISALKRKPRSRGKTTCERLKELFKRDPVFAVGATLEEIGVEIGRSASTIAGKDCAYYHSKLKPLREKHAAAKALASRDAAGLAVDTDPDVY
jgi:hypothetical protein